MVRKEKSMDNNYIQEELLRAMRIVAKSEVDKVNFDKTIVCTIKNNSKASDGEYYVTDGSSSFYAYSDITTYTVGTSVYVIIPGGDYNNRKIIIGKYMSSDGESYNYVPPSSQFITQTYNLLPGGEENRSLLANYQGTEFEDVDPLTINTITASSSILLGTSIIDSHKLDGYDYDTVYLKGDFKSLIGYKVDGSSDDGDLRNLTHGNYGLKLTILLKDSDGNQGDPLVFYLDTRDMNGNPYDFETYYQQEKIFKLPERYYKNGLNITSMSVEFFQEGGVDGGFYKSDGDAMMKKSPWYFPFDGTITSETVLLDPNLFVKNVELRFGYEQEKVNKNQVVIKSQKNGEGYGSDGQNPRALNYYSYLPDTEIQRLKKAGNQDTFIELYYITFLNWYNQKTIVLDAEKTFIELVTKGTISKDDVEYRLYEYIDPTTVDQAVSDPDAGDNWQQVDFTNLSYTFTPDITKTEQKFKVIAFFDDPLGTEEITDDYGVIITPNTKHLRVTSEELIFSLIGAPQEPNNQYLTIDCDNNGIFKIYDLKGHLINSFSKNIKRYLSAHKVNSDETISTITWKIPYVNTMIEPISYEEFMSLADDESSRGYKRNLAEGVIEYTIIRPTTTDFYFRIKDYLSPADTNNTITCVAKFSGSSKYETVEKTIEFCTVQQHGTEYKVAANFYDGKNALALGTTQKVKVRVLNAENIEITQQLIDSGYRFNLEWYNKPDQSAINYSFAEDSYTEFYFLLGASDDLIPGARITEDTDEYRITEEEPNIRIIEDIEEDSGNVQTRGSSLRSAASGGGAAMDYVDTRITDEYEDRITDEGETRITDTIIDEVPNLPQYYGSHIIKISIFDFEGNNIVGYFPVPVTISDTYTMYVGPTEIMYDSTGANPAYYKGIPSIYYFDPNTKLDVENTEVTWSLYAADGLDSNFPEYQLTEPSNILMVPPVFVNGRKCINMVCKASDAAETYLWVQPILITKDEWDNPVLNDWYTWTVQSITAGAARRSSDGNVSGVFMGRIPDDPNYTDYNRRKEALESDITTVQNAIQDNQIYLEMLIENGDPQGEIPGVESTIALLTDELVELQEQLAQVNALIDACRTVIGLYGMYKGETFFHLTEEGSLTLGSNNEINFSNNSGLIQSTDNSTIKLDLYNNSFKINSPNLVIDSNATGNVILSTSNFAIYKTGALSANQITCHQMTVNTSGQISCTNLTVETGGKVIAPELEISGEANIYEVTTGRIDVYADPDHANSGIIHADQLQAPLLSIDTNGTITTPSITVNSDYGISSAGVVALSSVSVNNNSLVETIVTINGTQYRILAQEIVPEPEPEPEPSGE